jgi:hypothetical protein
MAIAAISSVAIFSSVTIAQFRRALKSLVAILNAMLSVAANSLAKRLLPSFGSLAGNRQYGRN